MEELRLAKFSIDHSTVGTLWINWDSRVRYANHMAERMLGYLPGQVIDRPLSDLEPSLSMERWHELWKRVRSGDGAANRRASRVIAGPPPPGRTGARVLQSS